METTILWVFGFAVIIAVMIGVVWVIERKATHHETTAQAIADERDTAKAEAEKLQQQAKDEIDKLLGQLNTSLPAIQQRLDTSLPKLEQTMNAKVDELIGWLQTRTQPSLEAKSITVPIPSKVVPAATGPFDMLGATYIDRDDLLKAIGVTHETRPIVLDGKPIHNGIGEEVEFYTWPDGGGVRQQQYTTTAATATKPA